MRPLAIILILIICRDTKIGATNTGTSFRGSAQSVITDSEAAVPARSRLDCARKCKKFSHCISWAFDSDAGTCYLHPTVGATMGTVPGLRIYTDTDPACKESECPDDTMELTCSRTLTSFEGVCTSDFMWDLAPASCSATGGWEIQPCKQRIWRNVTVTGYQVKEYFPLPGTPAAGWSVCLTLTPTTLNYQFGVNLKAGSDYWFHSDFRYNHGGYTRTTIFDSSVGGWGAHFMELADPNPTFPVAPGQKVLLQYRTVSGNQIDVYADGSYYGSSPTLPLSVSAVTDVMIAIENYDVVEIEVLDVWCT